MGQIPEVDKKPKYNSNAPYEWVDSQWEKFMTEQSKLKAEILKLTMENAEMSDRLIELGESSDFTFEDVCAKLKEENDFLQKDTLSSFNRVVELSKREKELKTIVHDTPNNMELGKKIRSIINDDEDY